MTRIIATLILAIHLLSFAHPVAATPAAPTQWENIVPNGSFEQGTTTKATDWNTDPKHTRSSDRAHTGKWSLKAVTSGAETISWVAVLSVRHNTNYWFSAWIYKENAAGLASVDMNDIPGEMTLQTGSSGQWTYVDGIWNSGSNTSLILRAITSADVSGAVWFDDIALQEVQLTTHPRSPKIVTTKFPTDDVVVVDFDISDYEADPTGKNDSSQAIQQALDDCFVSGGGTVWLPAGTYKVTQTIRVRAFCSLRGDWRDPDTGSGSYGTLIKAEPPSGSDPLFLISGSTGVIGLTIYYPNQQVSSPVAYGWTFEVRGNAELEGYHASSVANVTLINAYQAIGMNVPPYEKNIHELSRVSNVKGTVLYRGVDARNGADVGSWRNINFDNSYWANAPAEFNPPDRALLDQWTRSNLIAFTISDLEWDKFYKIAASDCNVGIRFVRGARLMFAGQFLYPTIVNCEIAVSAEPKSIDDRGSGWGTAFLGGVLHGNTSAIMNNSTGYLHLTDTTIIGATNQNRLNITNPGTAPTAYPEVTPPKVTRAVLYDVTEPPYNAPYTAISVSGDFPVDDATTAIQQALDEAGKAGGGVVYLPAGWYRLNNHLNVPANVELRGSSSVLHRSQRSLSYGTVLFAYEGQGTRSPTSDPALINLTGDGAGINGLRVFYPENVYTVQLKVYPYAIRGSADDLYVTNTTIENGYLGLDMAAGSDRHYIRNLVGSAWGGFIKVGQSSEGRIEECLSNPNFWHRSGYGYSPFFREEESYYFWRRLVPALKKNSILIIIDGASNEYLLNNFIYGGRMGVYVKSGTAAIYNIGTDNTGEYTVKAETGTAVSIMNSMRFGGLHSAVKVLLAFNLLRL